MNHRAALRAPGVSDAMLHHLAGAGPPTPLDCRCQAPHAWRASPIAGRAIIPLWECGMVLDYYDQSSRRFERCSLENIEEAGCSYPTLQGLLAELLFDGDEDGVEDDALCAWACQFGLHGAQRMLAECGSHKARKDYPDWRASRGASCVDAAG